MSDFIVPTMEPSVGLLPGRPEIGFRFTATKTLEGHWPTQQQSAQQPEVSPEVTMGEMWTQVSTLTDGTTRTVGHNTHTERGGELVCGNL